MENKINAAVEQINNGNKNIDKILTERKKFKSEYSKASKELETLKAEYKTFKDMATPKLEELESKSKMVEEQKNMIDYLNKKLTEEKAVNSKASSYASGGAKFQPSGSFTPSYGAGSMPPTIPKTSTSFQPSNYRQSFSSKERPQSAISNISNRYSNAQMTPSQANRSPFSRYSENKGTPSANSVHSINISGMSAANSVHSSYQVHNAGTPAGVQSSNNGQNFVFKPENASNVGKMVTTGPKNYAENLEKTSNEENKDPNSMKQSIVHMTKPGFDKYISASNS